MNIHPEDIDRLFREAAEQLDNVPSHSFRQDRFWQQLQTRLEPPVRKTPSQIGYRVAAGILLFVVAGIIWWQFYEQKQQLKIYAQELQQLKAESIKKESLNASIENSVQRDTVYIREYISADDKGQTLNVKDRNVAKSKTVVPNDAVVLSSVQKDTVYPTFEDTLSKKVRIAQTTRAPSEVRKPLRIVHINELSKQKVVPEWQQIPSFMAKSQKEDEHTPKLTISLIQKPN